MKLPMTEEMDRNSHKQRSIQARIQRGTGGWSPEKSFCPVSSKKVLDVV